MDRPQSPAAERNRRPILAVLRRILPRRADVLEVGAGTGQHADFFTAEQPGWHWWPTNEPQQIGTLAAGLEGLRRGNLHLPQPLDVNGDWPGRFFDAVFTANTAHILPESGVRALMAGSARSLRADGRLILYGPFRRGGEHTAESNARFDEELKARGAGMGIRDLADIDEWAGDSGLTRIAELGMPANNLILVFEAGSTSALADHDRPADEHE